MSTKQFNLSNLQNDFAGLFHSAIFIMTALLIISFLVFLYFWLKEPRRLVNGILFTVFLFCGMIEVGTIISVVDNGTLTSIVVLIFIALMAIILFFVLFGWLLLIWNALVVWRHESHVLANMLTMIIGIGLIILWIVNLFNWNKILPGWLNNLIAATPIIGTYLGFLMYNFLLNLALYQFVPKRYPQDYLIVLGAGLINGDTVSKLLGSRIDRAITYYNKQVKKGLPAPKVIFSGGQGKDEKVSEAFAMSEYAKQHGLPAEAVLLEDQSKTTLQNMQFSKSVAINDSGNTDFKAKFFSNNYHIFRAGLFAKEAGINANGVGSKTRFYFLPNAIIREFLAVFMLHKKRHAIVIIGIALIGVFSAVVTLLTN